MGAFGSFREPRIVSGPIGAPRNFSEVSKYKRLTDGWAHRSNSNSKFMDEMVTEDDFNSFGGWSFWCSYARTHTHTRCSNFSFPRLLACAARLVAPSLVCALSVCCSVSLCLFVFLCLSVYLSVSVSVCVSVLVALLVAIRLLRFICLSFLLCACVLSVFYTVLLLGFSLSLSFSLPLQHALGKRSGIGSSSASKN